MSVQVRPARRADLGAILALEEATFPEETYGEIALRQFIDLFPARFLVAESENTVAGYALGGIDDAGEGWLLSLGVSPAFQGQGIGTRLLGAVLATLKDAPVIRLTVLPGNGHAVALYEKNGFCAEALRPDYYGPGQDRLVMVRPL